MSPRLSAGNRRILNPESSRGMPEVSASVELVGSPTAVAPAKLGVPGDQISNL